MKKNEKGFAVLEGLLIVVIVVLIGFVGWYVLKVKGNTNKTPSTSTGSNTGTKIAQPLVETSGPNKGYLVVKEWGIRIKPDTNLPSVSYTYTKGDDQTYSRIMFHIVPVDESTCNGAKESDTFSSWGIGRYSSDATYYPEGGTKADAVPIKEGMQDFIKQNTAKEIGTYYYIFHYPQLGCSTEAPAGIGQKLNDTALQMFHSIEPSQ